MSKFYWKASNIDNLTDARFFNALEDAWIEYVFDATEKRAVNVEQANNITEWLFEPHLLASFGNHQTPDEIYSILKECGIQYAAVSILHELSKDQDFLPLAFLKVTTSDLEDILRMPVLPFAIIVKTESQFTDQQLNQIQNLLKKIKLFVQLPSDIEGFKSQLAEFEEIGIEIPTEPEDSPGMGAVDVYDYLIESLIIDAL